MLVIGIEAAEPRLVRELLGRGALPELGRLLEEGAWTHVESPANITSGAVWPTFYTGRDPTEHEVTGAWCWQPDRMGCTAPDYGSRTMPFWKALHDNGMTVGVLDVPFSPFLGLSRGFEVLEWGAHDPPEVSMRVSPRMLRKVVSQTVHPFSVRRRR